MLIINNRFLSVYDYNFLLYYEKIFSVKQPKDQRFKAMKNNMNLRIFLCLAVTSLKPSKGNVGS
jgi:hypothetical protein